MYFKRLACLGLLLSCSHTSSAETWLRATPNQCVSLEPGRICYATIHVQWQVAAATKVCLMLDQQPLQCFDSSHPSTSYRLEFAASQSQLLQLQVDGKVVAQQPLQVSYVQKANKIKRRWRLF